MASMVIIGAVHLFMLMCITDAQRTPFAKIFNVQTYGAAADGRTDNSKAFLRAWSDACRWNGNAWVLIPAPGTYMLHPIVFAGPCMGKTGVEIGGVLKATSDPAIFYSSDHWIIFRYVNQLEVKGDGSLDGQGVSAWRFNNCQNNPQCKPLPGTMRFDFVNNSAVHDLKSINSKNLHLNIFMCNNMTISHVGLSSPGDSPNTDGIKVAESSNIKIEHSIIGTGDDCIAMLAGTQNVEISDIFCGPGHGISVGSIGRGNTEAVRGINIRNCTLSGTQNGLRIKTWAPSSPSLVSDFVFEDIIMQNVNNPIIIDQNYCPGSSCNQQEQSMVQIRNVTYGNIQGTSSSTVAVNIKCSGDVPCQDINLENINLVHNGAGGQATAVCSNVKGRSSGTQKPQGCL